MMIQQRNYSVGYSRLSPSLQLCLAGYGGPESPYPHSSSPLPGGWTAWSQVWPPEDQKTTTVLMKQYFMYTLTVKARAHQNISADHRCSQARIYFCTFVIWGKLVFTRVISWQSRRCWCFITLCMCHALMRLMWDQLKCPWPDAHLLSEARELPWQLGIPLLQLYGVL